MGKLDGRVAIVTGGARGIGAAYAKQLASEGAKVVVADMRDPSATVAAIKAAGGAAHGRVTDVSQSKDTQAVVAETVKAFGKLDILVNNAGLFADERHGSFLDLTNADWDKVYGVNVRGPFLMVKAAVPEMAKRKYGKIVNITSSTHHNGVADFLHYVSSKGAVDAFTRALAREVGDDGIRVNAIAPGLTMSEAIERDRATFAPNIAFNMKNRALKRDELPDDLVGTCLFLCAPDSDFMTGQTIVVDGGSVMH